MIKKVTIYCSFYGKEFSAKSLQKSLPLLSWDIYQEQGEIANSGRYKGLLAPYSHCLLRPATSLSYKTEIENLLQSLKHNKLIIEKFVIEDIEINIQVSYMLKNKLLFTTILLDTNGKITDIDEDFVLTPAGQEFIKNINNKSQWKQTIEESNIVVMQDDFMFSGYSGGITQDKYKEYQQALQIHQENNKKHKYSLKVQTT